MESFRTAQELPDPLQLCEDVKLETCTFSDEDDDEQQNGFQMNLIKEEDPEDEHYLCGGKSTCVEEEKIPVEPESEIHLSQMGQSYCGIGDLLKSKPRIRMEKKETKTILKLTDHHSHQPLHITETLQYEAGSHQCHFHRHQNLDARHKPYPCPQCGKSFRKLWNLHRHQSIHTGEKPFQCSECGTSFNRKHTLQVHRRIHMEKKLYQCSQCKNSFSRLGHLKMHQSVHAREILLNC